MAHCASGRCVASILMLSLFASAAAYAAADNVPAEKPAQTTTAPDDRSYLPPWMRTQPAAATPGAPLREGAQVSAAQPPQTAEAADAKKAKGAGQGQIQRRRRQEWPGGFFGGVASFFGR